MLILSLKSGHAKDFLSTIVDGHPNLSQDLSWSHLVGLSLLAWVGSATASRYSRLRFARRGGYHVIEPQHGQS